MDFKELHSIKNETATIFLYDSIGLREDGRGIEGARVAELINMFDSFEHIEEIKIRINSGGGSVLDGYSIMLAIMATNKPVHTYADGIAGSIAGIIFQAGDKRYISDFGKVMIHNPVSGKSKNENQKKAINALKDSLMTVLENNSKMDRPKIDELMNAETWFSAGEAVALGLADEVISTKRVIDVDNIVSKDLMLIMNEVHTKQNIKPKSNKMKDVLNFLDLDENTEEGKVLETVKSLKNSITEKEADLESKSSELTELKNKVEALEKEKNEANKTIIVSKIENAIENGVFKKEEKEALVQKFENNLEALELVVKATNRQPVDVMNHVITASKAEEEKGLRELEKSNPAKVEEIKNNNPELYKVMFKKEYGVEL